MRSLSTLLIDSLRGQGMTMREIGELIGVSESYISRVASGENNLTIDHLVALERALRRPLPLLLLEACRNQNVPAALKSHYDRLIAVLSESGDIEEPEADPPMPTNSAASRRSR